MRLSEQNIRNYRIAMAMNHVNHGEAVTSGRDMAEHLEIGHFVMVLREQGEALAARTGAGGPLRCELIAEGAP